ncbi:hypothetical protein [Pseudoalteromonas ulvae]|uniref:Fe2OG dioxygenase domain-containing protein n=1 Tax=Pseudoalteromonas ulvae TaxID=107327 RepID=A0A244CL86_PSEDV|nr:hypothetical protein [Pseudoalteromonas ulvae]OUL56381.1 hypothetical protein B1199_17055 [Pseudoalteromonas ulvae]
MNLLLKLFRWQTGRQGTGYEKMLLGTAKWPIKFDLYLLKFPEGCEVPPHTDKVQCGRHYRLNVVLKAAKSGGDFICDSSIINTRRIKLFRPDLCEHSVTKVESGNRYVFSLGWVKSC